MAHTVIDSNNLEAILADAGVETVSRETKPEIKAEKPEKPETESNDADDAEGPDGLTPRQKRELSTSMLKAIGKKHRQMKEAEEFAAAQYREKTQAEQRAQDLARENAELKAKVTPPVKAPQAPTREDFATEGEYIDAKIQWGVDQGIRQREADREEAARVERANQALEKAKELVPDFEEVTQANLNWPGPVAQYMRHSDMFAELGYHFAKNPTELTRIANLPPDKQLVAVGKIEAILQPFGKAPKADDGVQRPTNGAHALSTDTGLSPSKAREAPVIKPLSSGEGTQFEPEIRDLNVREHIQTWQKDNKVNLRLRKRH